MKPSSSTTIEDPSEGAEEAEPKKRKGRKRKDEKKMAEPPIREQRECTLRKKAIRDEQNPEGPKKLRKRFTEEEIAEMWLFVVNKCRDPVTQKIIRPKLKWISVWEEFIEFAESTRDRKCLNLCFQRLKKTLYATTFDLQTKTNLYYALEMPVDNEEFLEKIKAVADVVLDKSNRIIAYRKKRRTGSLVSHDEDYWDEVWDEEEIQRRQNEEKGEEDEEVEDVGEGDLELDETDELDHFEP